MTEPLAAWATAFVSAQADFPNIPKSKTANIPIKGGSSHYSYNYADLADVLQAVQPVLSKHGLAQAQSVQSDQGQVSVTTRLYHRDGHVESFGPVTLKADVGAQAAGSAITYARRYALCAALGITPDEDDDGAIAQATSGSASSSETPKTELQVCPGCGAQSVERVKSSSERAPKWACRNDACKGGKEGRSWASWKEDEFGTGSAAGEGQPSTEASSGGVDKAEPVAGEGTPVDPATPSQPPQWVADLVKQYGEQEFVDAAEALRERTMPQGAPILSIEDPIFQGATENTQREITRLLDAAKASQDVGQSAVTGSAGAGLATGDPVRPAESSETGTPGPGVNASASSSDAAPSQNPPSRQHLLQLIETACEAKLRMDNNKALSLGYVVTKANTIATKTPGLKTIQVLDDSSDELLIALVDELDLEAKIGELV